MWPIGGEMALIAVQAPSFFAGGYFASAAPSKRMGQRACLRKRTRPELGRHNARREHRKVNQPSISRFDEPRRRASS